MLSRILPYLLALAATLLAWSEHERAEAINKILAGSQSAVRQLSADNLVMKTSVDQQNQKVSELKGRASAEAMAAAARAAEKLEKLPKRLEADHRSGAKPEEMNQWLDSLFSY